MQERDQEQLNILLGELKARFEILGNPAQWTRLHSDRGFDNVGLKSIQERVRKGEEWSLICADTAWAGALIDVGIDASTILRIWALKDDNMRQMREGLHEGNK